MKTAKDVLKFIKENDVKYVDFRFTDPRGKWQHVTFDITIVDEDALDEHLAPRSALDRITALLPGAGAPTVIPLSGRDDAVAVHAVCQEAVFWETLESLKGAGASAILVLPIEKMM